MNLLALFHKPAKPPLRAIVATKQESLAAAVKRINTHNKLAVENALFPRPYLPRPAYVERMRGR
jgi:hypothetical protein